MNKGNVMKIQTFINEFKLTFVYALLRQTLTDDQLFEYSVQDGQVIWFKEQTRQMWHLWTTAAAEEVPDGFALVKVAKAQAVPEGFILVKKEPYAYLIKHKLWNKNSQPEIYLADDFIGNDGVEKEKLTVCIPLYKGGDEAQEQKG